MYRKTIWEDIQLDESDTSLSKTLAIVAVGCWLVSLALPGFIVATRAEAWFGGLILLFGILFGWTVNGWAVYANLFFVAVVFALYRNRTPRVSVVLMLFLAATLPLFSGVIQDAGSGTKLPVVSWGWGAVLWLYSLILVATAAGLRAGIVNRTATKVMGGVLAVAFLSIVALNYWQWLKANEQEKDVYLSKGMAFTVTDFCDIPFSWPKNALVPANETVSLDVDPKLRTGRDGYPYLFIPSLRNFQQDGLDWVTFRDPNSPSIVVKVRGLADSKRFVLQGKTSPEGAVIRLVDSQNNTALYEQRLKTRPGKWGGAEFCPASEVAKGYDKAVLRAVGQDREQKYPREVLQTEVAQMPCSLSSDNLDGTNGMQSLKSWDGRTVNLQPESLRTLPGFCSRSYVGLVHLSIDPGANAIGLHPIVHLFDRKTMRPIATFTNPRLCFEGCKVVANDVVLGLRVEGENVTVLTTRGEASAKRAH
jgi:hypothetical protein